jgi:hypothetical protein
LSITDGGILFISCALSFAVGYVIGAFRVTRFVGREIDKVTVELIRHRKGLEQFYTKLGEEDKNHGTN